MWRRWRHELEERRRESDRRHAEWKAEHARLLAAQKRGFDKIDIAMENDKRVTREIVLELQAGRARDRDAHDQMRAMTEGLVRVLDEFRRDDGPSPAGA